MPELPEVETIRRDIEQEFVGKRVKKVEVTGARSVRRHPDPAEFSRRLEGRRLTGAERRGKYLVLPLDHAEVLVVHLGMSGQLLRADPKDALARHTHVVLWFSGAPQLRFVDPRTFGELFVAGAGQLDRDVPALEHLGFDPIGDPMTWTSFAVLLGARRVRLKALLMDQRVVAGIGNLYADEILFAAGLRPDRPSDTLGAQEVRRLYRAMVETLQEAIKHRGSSLADEQYRDLSGAVGAYQLRHHVYARDGAPCPRCRTPIVRVRGGGRSTYFCPGCQV